MGDYIPPLVMPATPELAEAMPEETAELAEPMAEETAELAEPMAEETAEETPGTAVAGGA